VALTRPPSRIPSGGASRVPFHIAFRNNTASGRIINELSDLYREN
jgi:hypothetical protein